MPPPPVPVKNAGADRHGKGSSGNPARTERKHTTKKLTSAKHPETDSKHRHEKQGDSGKKRRSANTADTGGSHTTGHSSSIKITHRPGEGLSVNSGGRDMRIKNDAKAWEMSINPDALKSKGQHGKVKATESSRDNRSAEQRR